MDPGREHLEWFLKEDCDEYKRCKVKLMEKIVKFEPNLTFDL